MEQLFLQAVMAEVQRTGVEETVFEKVYHQLIALCVFDGKSLFLINYNPIFFSISEFLCEQ